MEMIIHDAKTKEQELVDAERLLKKSKMKAEERSFRHEFEH